MDSQEYSDLQEIRRTVQQVRENVVSHEKDIKRLMVDMYNGEDAQSGLLWEFRNDRADRAARQKITDRRTTVLTVLSSLGTMLLTALLVWIALKEAHIISSNPKGFFGSQTADPVYAIRNGELSGLPHE